MVASSRYQYAGALDALATDSDGRVHIIDFKTSNSVHSSYALQLAAYVHAFAEMYTNGDIEAPKGALPQPASAADSRTISTYAPVSPASPIPAQAPPSEGDNIAFSQQGASVSPGEHESSDEDEIPPWLQTPEFDEPASRPGSALRTSASNQETARVSKRTVVRNRSSSSKSKTSSVFGSPAGLGAVRSLCSSTGDSRDELDKRAYPISALVAGATLREASSSAYATGLGQQAPLLLSGRVVRFDKRTGQAHEHTVGDLSVSFNAFKAALYLWRVTNMQAEALLSH